MIGVEIKPLAWNLTHRDSAVEEFCSNFAAVDLTSVSQDSVA